MADDVEMAREEYDEARAALELLLTEKWTLGWCRAAPLMHVRKKLKEGYLTDAAYDAWVREREALFRLTKALEAEGLAIQEPLQEAEPIIKPEEQGVISKVYEVNICSEILEELKSLIAGRSDWFASGDLAAVFEKHYPLEPQSKHKRRAWIYATYLERSGLLKSNGGKSRSRRYANAV